VDEVKKKMTEA